MSIRLEEIGEFITKFQKKIIVARKLLFASNHKWAAKLFKNLTMEIEKNEWLDLQKKHQLIMIISNSWWIYLNSLRKQESGKVKIDLIKYIDAYKRFFSFLAKLDNFYLFQNFGTALLKQFIKREDLSHEGITLFINSFSAKLQEREEYQKLIELQILLMFLRKSVAPSEHFHLSMAVLNRAVKKLEPSKRTLFLYMILEQVCIRYQLLEDSSEFVRIINKILINRLPQDLKNEFSNIGRLTINARSFKTILVDLEDLINYLNDVGEYSWIIIIIRNIFSKMQAFGSLAEAVTYIRKFIDFSLKRNRFEIAFEIYDFLEDIFILQSDLSYDRVLIELWVEACKNFVDMKEKRYLLQSLEKLNTHLKTPQTSADVFHYFYTSNILWQFKSMFFSLEKRDFWRMMFYRALFEEQNYKIAPKIINFLDQDFNRLLTDLTSLSNEAEPLKKQIYSFIEDEESFLLAQKSFAIKFMIIKVDSKGRISYRMISTKNEIIEGIVTNEYWNDTHILEIYNELFYESEKRKYNFTLNEFGELLFLFLPKIIRNFFKSFKIDSLNLIPQVYFILDNMTIPFDLIYDNNFFLLKYSSGFKIGETPLGGITFEQFIPNEPSSELLEKKYNVLIIDTLNSKSPIIWNEKLQQKDLIYPFPTGTNELNSLINFFHNREEVDQITTLLGPNSTRENISTHLSQDYYHIITFVGNIFYSKWSPKDSYLIANDNEIITFREINKLITQVGSKVHPFLFFNTQTFDTDGNKFKNVLKSFGEIVEIFDQNKVTGVMTRSYPLFNEDTKNIISNFFLNLFSNKSQGVSILQARQQCISNKLEDLEEKTSVEIDLRSILAVSSYILFGQPWKNLNP